MATEKETTNKAEPSYSYDITVALDRSGLKQETFRIKELSYGVYKAARGFLQKDPEKAMAIIMGNIVIADDKEKWDAALKANEDNLAFLA